MDHVAHLQQQLAQAMDSRHTQDCKRIIEELSNPDIISQFPNSLSCYFHPRQHSSPLLHAISKCHEDIAILLLEKGCDPFADGSTSKIPGIKSVDIKMSKTLFRVLEKPGFEKVCKAILEKADKLIVDKNGDTVLHVIVKKKLVSMLEVAFQSKWLAQMLHHVNNQGCLPMHIAASSNFLLFFQIVFQGRFPSNGLEVSEQSCFPSLQTCELREHIQQATCNLNVNTSVKLSKATALHLCAGERSVPGVKLLLELGSNVNATDATGKTPLVECLDQRGEKKVADSSLSNLIQICKVLLQAGANVNVRSRIQYSERRSMANDDIVTPLHLAAGLGATDVTELLLNNGADPRQLSGDIGKIPLQFALEQGHNDTALVLLAPELYPEGFLATHLDYAFNSLLHSADKCSPEIIERLIDLSCPLDRPNVNHLRPLDKAITSRNLPCVQLLLNTQPHIVNVQFYQDPTAYPPLHLAASSGNVHLCQILLSFGADIYARAYGKHMAYRKAFKFGRFETAVYLCEQMSRPFTRAEEEELLNQAYLCESDLAQRLHHRLEEIPTLVSSCLDTIRRVFIKNHLSFKNIHKLPVPEAVIKALRYQNTDCSSSVR